MFLRDGIWRREQGLARYYDVTTAGRRFLLLEQVEAQTEGQPLTLITNWLEAAKK